VSSGILLLKRDLSGQAINLRAKRGRSRLIFGCIRTQQGRGHSKMKLGEGAIALIDALGFRGIWARHDPSEVLTIMKDMKDEIESKIEFQFKTQPDFNCQIAFLSDTIAVSMTLGPSFGHHRQANSALYLCDVLSWILNWTLRSKVPLAYRGAVAVGSFELSSQFLIGPAVDEAAAAYEMAQGALIWLTPNALDLVAKSLRDRPENTHLVKFDVPLKGGDTFETYTVSPLEQAWGAADADIITRALLGTFSGSSVDVALKRQNTIRHMKSCYAWRKFPIPQMLVD
jgi:hypothetical protein